MCLLLMLIKSWKKIETEMIMKEIQKRMMQNIDKEVKPFESNYAGLYAIIFMRSSQLVLAFDERL